MQNARKGFPALHTEDARFSHCEMQESKLTGFVPSALAASWKSLVSSFSCSTHMFANALFKRLFLLLAFGAGLAFP